MSRRGRHHSSAGHGGTSNLQHEDSAAQSEHTDHFPAEHRTGLLPEKYFRWRAGEITRLEAFCDVVFGFAITLLVVSLEVPRNYEELIVAMRGFVPFAICFLQLILIWRTHYKFSRRYGLEDPYTMTLNITLLFLVLFYVYPLKFVFTLLFNEVTGQARASDIGFHEASVLMRIYAAGFTAVFLLFVLMYAHAYKLRKAIGLNELEVNETRVSMQECAILAGVGVVSYGVAIKSPAWSGWTYGAIGPLFTLHGMIFGKRTRRLAEKLGLE